MNSDRRRHARIPIFLKVHIQRENWRMCAVEDISKRGLFVRTAFPIGTTQLIRIRISLPHSKAPLEMMAKVARRFEPRESLVSGRLPGWGLEIFYLNGDVLTQWDLFLSTCLEVRALNPGCNRYELYRKVEEATGKTSRGPMGSRQVSDGSGVHHLVFRAQNLAGLTRFMNSDLDAGQFRFRMPYPMQEEQRACLRIIHPVSEEEVTLAGKIYRDNGPSNYMMRFDHSFQHISDDFRVFVNEGRASALAGGCA